MSSALAYAARATRQSDRECLAPARAATLGRDETLAERHVVIWSVLDPACPDEEPWLDEAVEELRGLLRLPPGWDSYASAPIDAGVASNVMHLLKLLVRERAPRPTLVPTVAGGVQLEWYGGGLEAQLEVEPGSPDVTLFYRHLQSGDAWEGKVGESPEPLGKLLWKIASAR